MARRMEKEIEAQITHHDSPDDLKILINIFIHAEDMFVECVSSGAFQNESVDTVRDFARGFTESRPCYTMVDVGPGPGIAFAKISGEFMELKIIGSCGFADFTVTRTAPPVYQQRAMQACFSWLFP